MKNESNVYRKLDSTKIIGIIGSDDKIITAYILEEILRNAGYRTGLISKSNILVDGKNYIISERDREQFKINNIVKNMKHENIDVIIIEIQSSQIKALCEENLEIDILIHTNTMLDEYKNDRYLEDKIKLISSLEDSKIAIINIDDDNSIRLIEKNKDIIVISYGLNGKSSITASSLSLDKVSKFNLCLQRGITTACGNKIDPLEFPISSNLLGRDSMYNTLAAIGACLYLDISLDTISRTLLNTEGIHRMLKKIYDKEFIVIDCFADSPSNYESALYTIQSLDYNKLIIVNSISDEKSKEVNDKIANIIIEWKDILNLEMVLFASNEDNEKTADYYGKMFKDNNIKCKTYRSLEDSIKEGLNNIKSDDIFLLLGGKDMDNGKEIIRLQKLI
ncbi:UDP-N-acetylmuramoyl-L-alanyl-D-glutamate--2,6-diaminopimelate ligase MurE [Gottschalkia acidurici 9a]|uniref:UDP-N-acetylmuramoyl-L-alanyl-D-glutamate--2, 6-diaminopimelate ligase MurE n=1 Tax=Gottschalkia acidurici (strain ATCC 7906 / DSM 604 / BCRC 14475 / CIP 104303 / KCTC 5404 / NCIMB 10678 / 9a) TaxID=1128398 RepID=K0AVP1_GOTA9|nr:Mur ligase family protein [Gottschalkia acidurici]AFS77908.1 UDP-N-acetylmuramoyl-L-alanyl-D-glutamate--2,6-diaminopimelate ligase MurE [Gottschalkia acidurici 9a]